MKSKRGSRQIVNGRLYGLFWLGGEKRQSVPLSGVNAKDTSAVADRCELVADVAYRLGKAGRSDKSRDFAVQLGAATSSARVEAILKQVKLLVDAARVVGDGITVKQFGARWTSGDLARSFPDHVKVKATAGDDVQILRDYVEPVIGNMAVRAVRLEDGERVMASLPPMSAARRRHVAQAMHRLFGLAVYPAKVIATHPFPKGFLPKLGPAKAKQHLYPDEDAQLCACTAVPLVFRLFYGVIDREGFRFKEARGLDWADIDLKRGAVRLDKNKTNDPRAWALDPGVLAALTRWKELSPAAPFQSIPEDEKQAERFREHVVLAGIERGELFESSDRSRRLWFHDLRATFVTVSLANDKTETWVSDRTGHRSSAMIAKYQRAARTYRELNLGPLQPLDKAIVWKEDCQKSVKGPGKMRRTEEAQTTVSTEGGTRTLTSVRTADFESALASHNGAKSRKKQGARSVEARSARTFDRLLTDLDETKRSWSAYEISLDGMSESEGSRS